MSSMPKCKCGENSVNIEISKGKNRGRWVWKCAKNLCGFYQINDPGKSTYTFTSYTIPRKPDNIPFSRPPSSNKHVDRTMLNLDNDIHSSASLSLGSGNDKRRTSRSRSKRQGDLTEVQLALYTNTDISVTTKARHGFLQTLFNTIPKVAWMDDLRLWVFPADQHTYKQVWQRLQQNRMFEVIGVPIPVLKCLPKTTELLQDQLQQQVGLSQNVGIGNDDTLDNLLYDWDFNIDDDDDNDQNDKEHTTNHIDTDKSATTNGLDWKLEESIGASTLWQGMTWKQQSGLKKILDMDGHVYLQDSAGSGNSLQALGVTLVHRDDWPVLIICRATVCQKWTTLIQDMLLLDRHQISLLDHDPLSESSKAAQSRQRRKRERLKKQKETAAMVSSNSHSSSLATSKTSSTHGDKEWMVLKDKQTTNTIGRKKGDLWIRILDNSGDTPPFSPSNIKKNSNSNQAAMNHVTHTKKKDSSRKKQKLAKGGVYIKLVDNSGDYTSDTVTDCSNGDDDDSDFMDSNDSDTSNRTFKYHTTTSNAALNGDSGNKTQQAQQVKSGPTRFFIVSYDNVKTKLGILSATECKIIIFDDCHDLNRTLLPTYKSSIQNLVNASKKTIMVSDVPIIPKPIQSFPLLQILKPSLFDDFRVFGHRYCGAKQNVFGWDYTGLSNSFELEYLLSKTVLVA